MPTDTLYLMGTSRHFDVKKVILIDMEELIIHNNISDLYNELNLSMEQEMDLTIHFLPDIHPEVPFKSPTLRTNYYSFVFVKDGRDTYATD